MAREHDLDPQQLADDELVAKGFARAVRSLVGKPLLFHISTPISGVLLEFGEHVRLARPVDNPRLSSEQREYEGDSDVFITCTWWLDAPDGVIPPRGELDQLAWWMVQLSIIVGQTVKQVATTAGRRQLQIQFDNGVWIVAELDSARPHQDYAVRVGGEHWVVSAGGQLSHSTRRGGPP